jgi:3',5'-cyclic AMP phosphodiesterase CpdA
VYSVRHGRIHRNQMQQIEARLKPLPAHLTRVLVTHHPFDLPETFHARLLVARAGEALARLACCVDMLLAGHMHISYAGQTAARYKIAGRPAIFVQAGTATSTHNRGEPNAFNLITIDRPRLDVQRFTWYPDRGVFAATIIDRFELGADGWGRAPGVGQAIACSGR